MHACYTARGGHACTQVPTHECCFGGAHSTTPLRPLHAPARCTRLPCDGCAACASFRTLYTGSAGGQRRPGSAGSSYEMPRAGRGEASRVPSAPLSARRDATRPGAQRLPLRTPRVGRLVPCVERPRCVLTAGPHHAAPCLCCGAHRALCCGAHRALLQEDAAGMRRGQPPLSSRAGRVPGRRPSEDATSLRSDEDTISEATVGQALNAIRGGGKDWQKRVRVVHMRRCGLLCTVCASGGWAAPAGARA